nr:immunoglobulin heavy chain junction region [Mus musculus]
CACSTGNYCSMDYW